MTYQNYKHVIPIQLRFSDIDRLQHVNNSCYHNFVELGRVKYFNEVLGDQIKWNEQGFVLARTEMDHIESLYLNDEVYCFTRVESFGTKSMKMKSAIVKKTQDGLIVVAAVTGVLVAMNYAENVSMPVPQLWRELISKYESVI